jgi:hypothetical protein
MSICSGLSAVRLTARPAADRLHEPGLADLPAYRFGSRVWMRRGFDDGHSAILHLHATLDERIPTRIWRKLGDVGAE